MRASYYYEKRSKEMPIKVLIRHEIIKYQGGLVSLTTNTLIFVEKAKIMNNAYRSLYITGPLAVGYRFSEDNPILNSLRYQVFKASGGRCSHPLFCVMLLRRSIRKLFSVDFLI